jgi:hypothetical protein
MRSCTTIGSMTSNTEEPIENILKMINIICEMLNDINQF